MYAAESCWDDDEMEHTFYNFLHLWRMVSTMGVTKMLIKKMEGGGRERYVIFEPWFTFILESFFKNNFILHKNFLTKKNPRPAPVAGKKGFAPCCLYHRNVNNHLPYTLKPSQPLYTRSSSCMHVCRLEGGWGGNMLSCLPSQSLTHWITESMTQ